MPQVNGQDGLSTDQNPKTVKHGLWGQSNTGWGVVGTTDSGGVTGDPLNAGVAGYGWKGAGVSGYGQVAGVIGEGGEYGVQGNGNVAGVYGGFEAGRDLIPSFGVQGNGIDIGVFGEGFTFATRPTSGIGVRGESQYNFGMWATSENNIGLLADSDKSFGLAGRGGNVGIYAHNFTAERQGVNHDVYLSTGGNSGEFQGNVAVYGYLYKYGGGFKIDHLTDPANKYLSHSFVESEDMKNIYDGVAILDNKGKAEVELPDWFQALNKDFRYQLTPIGSAGPNLYIQQGITKNHFKIAGGTQGMKVSWQVTGIRKDPWANANRVKVEEEKPRKERGYYLNPHLYKKSQQRGIMWARYPEHQKIGRETMKKTKELLKNIPKAPERTRTQKRTK